MQQRNVGQIDRDSYDEITSFFRETSAELFQYLEIAEDLVNQGYLLILKKGEAQDMDQQQLTELFPQIVEKVFAEYRRLCFGYCLGKTQDPEIAGDIAQETIAQLLASRLPIRNIRRWIRQVAHNLLCAYYQENHQDRVLYKKLGIESDIAHQILENEELPAPELLADLLPEELKSSPDYQEYLILKQYSSLEDYALAQNISYDVAKRRSKKLLRDLGAKTLLALGWEDGPGILDFNQYRAIQKFMREILSIAPADGGSPDAKASSHKYDVLAELMQSFPKIDDWGIVMLGQRRYRLTIFHRTEAKEPHFATITIRLTARNSIEIIEGRKNRMAGVFKLPANMPLLMEKGKAVLTFEEIKDLIDR